MKQNPELLKVWNQRLYIRAEGIKRESKCYGLYAESNKLFIEAIIKAYGNIKVVQRNFNEKYKSHEWHLDNGEVYGFDHLETKARRIFNKYCKRRKKEQQRHGQKVYNLMLECLKKDLNNAKDEIKMFDSTIKKNEKLIEKYEKGGE